MNKSVLLLCFIILTMHTVKSSTCMMEALFDSTGYDDQFNYKLRKCNIDVFEFQVMIESHCINVFDCAKTLKTCDRKCIGLLENNFFYLGCLTSCINEVQAFPANDLLVFKGQYD